MKYNKILVIRFSSLGDIVLTTPLIRILHENFPSAQIDYCTKEEYKDVLKFNPAINKLISIGIDFDFKRLKLLKATLVANKYDLVIDCHNNLRTFYLMQFLRFKSKVLKFKKYSFRKFLLVKFKINIMKNLPSISDRYISIINKILPAGQRDIFDLQQTPEIFTDENAKTKIDNIFTELGINNSDKFIVIAPSSKHFTKTYPSELYIDLINKFDEKTKIILIGKGNDVISVQKIMKSAKRNIYNLSNGLNIVDLAELIKRCSLFISGDTGPMHIAETMNKPLIMLAGSSVKEFGFYPQSENAVILENNNLSCRPCSHIGRSSCPKGHFKCMKEITPDLIINQTKNLLQ